MEDRNAKYRLIQRVTISAVAESDAGTDEGYDNNDEILEDITQKKEILAKNEG